MEENGRSKNLIQGIYITAALENLGDLLNHMSHENIETKNIAIKYSKYLYRIFCFK